MIKSIFSDVYVQSFPQASRYNVYVTFLHFLLNRSNGKISSIERPTNKTFVFLPQQFDN